MRYDALNPSLTVIFVQDPRSVSYRSVFWMSHSHALGIMVFECLFALGVVLTTC